MADPPVPFPSSGPRLELPERPLSALSQATTASSASGGLRDRREVSQLNVNVPPSAVPFLSSRLRVESGATGRDSGSLGGGSTTAASDEPARSTSQPTHEGDWIHAAQPQPSAIGHLNGLGLALNVDAVSEPSTDEDGSDDEDAAEQLEPEEQAIFDRPTIHESARDWGEEDFEGDANDRDEGTSRPRLGSMRRPSAATFRGGNSSWLNPPASAASTGTGEEWRSRILESVRKGEERVAERRKVSVASVQTFDAGKTPLATVAALPTVPDESSSSSAPLPVDGEADRAAEPEAAIALPSPTTVDSRPLSPSLPPQASLDLPLPPSPTYSTSSHSPSFHSQRSSAALLPPSPTDERTRAHHPRGPALPPAPSPLAEGGTFLSVADPSAFTMRGSGLLSSPAPPSPARRTPRNFLSHFFSRDRANTTGSSIGHSRNTSSSSLARDAGYQSQPTTPAMAQRTRGQPADSTGMSRSASEGMRLSGFLQNGARPALERGTDSQMTIRPKVDEEERPTLATLGLKLEPLTPSMPISRYPQPLCGAVLDQKYLLIGTINGLDFLPLQQVVTGKSGVVKKLTRPLKPISLIKKTKIKDLAVLETRSNILLAIAGRNDHLRVYALDGIRAMIEKKMAEVGAKDDFVWLPKSFSGGDLKRSGSLKGKARASEAISEVGASSSSTGSSSQATQSLQSRIPLSSPPPYVTPPAMNLPLPPAPVPPMPPTLRRSSTVREGPTFARREALMASRRPSSISASPAATSSSAERSPALQESSARRNGSLQSEGSREVELGLPREDDSAPDGTPSGSSSAEMDRTDSQTSVRRRAAGAPKRGLPRDATTTSSSMTGLAQMLRDTEIFAPGGAESLTSSPKVASSPRSRMSPRSPVARSASDTESTDEDGTAPGGGTTRPRGLSLADMLAEGPPGSAQEPPRSPRPPSTPSRPRMMARSPTNRSEAEAGEAAVEGEGAGGRRRPSLAEILSEGPPPGVNGSPALSATSMRRDQSGNSLASAATDASPNLARSRKRWSMMDSVLRATSGSSSFSSPDPATRRRAESPALERIESREDPPNQGVALEGSSRPRPNVDSANAIAASPTASSSLVPPRLRARPSTQKFRPSDSAMGPDERIAERLATNKDADEAYTAPHPATLGAPLEYVKLARTKGARLLRAVETKKRTYLAVLCGDSGERVELFTGSKNISLSLNRTFVLPETPRSIEFQMQGDDLVDIYLVYDESVFALEPATVRVREVGIGRNERRSARRERERAARDAASVNLQASVPATPAVSAGPAPVPTPPLGLGITDADSRPVTVPASISNGRLNSIPEATTLSRPLPAAPTATTPTSGTTPTQPDEGLTLAPPTPPAPSRRAAVNSAGGESAGYVPANDGSGTQWPYTTFQQLSFTPPLPASVLASTYVIPPSYEAVVTASTHNTPAVLQRSTMGPSPSPDQHSPSVTVHLPHGSDVDGADSRLMSPDPSSMPLLSPVSLLAPSIHRQAGPPGLFWISRGRKITAIVDCDGRSVLKRPFLWQSPASKPTEADAGLRRLEVLVVDQKRPIVVGFHATGVGAFEIGGKTAKSSESWSNSAPLPVRALQIKAGAVPVSREVTYLGFSRTQNEVVWAERAGGTLGVFALSAKSSA